METNQHRGTQIKFMEKLCDKDVNFQNIGDILPFNVPQHIDEPFEVLVRWANPQEVDFLACDAGVAIGACAEH